MKNPISTLQRTSARFRTMDAKDKRRFVLDGFLNNALYIVMLVFVIYTAIRTDNFLTLGSLANLINQVAAYLPMALGIAGCIVLTGTDLSAGRIQGLTAAVSAVLLQKMDFANKMFPMLPDSSKWWWIGLTLLVAIAVGFLIGLLNGFFVAKFSLHPFIVTLGTQLISYGLCCIYIENQPSGSTQALSSLDQRYLALATGSVDIFGFKLPYLVIIFLLLGVLTWLVWNKTRFGKNMFAVGGNSEAAEVSGVSVTKTIMGVFLYAGLMYGIASFLEGARIQSVGTATGINYELDAIAGCVIGGVSFNGGIGTVPGVVIGSIILQAINYGLYFLGVNAYLQYIIRGAIIIIAVAIDVQKYVAKK